MIFSRNRSEVRRLAREFRMPESDIRQMLAFESGKTLGDVKDSTDTQLHRGYFFRLLSFIGIAGIISVDRGHA